MPFAVLASTQDIITRDGHKVRGRSYAWGHAQVESDDHSEFRSLRNLVVRLHLDDLVQATDLQHYEAVVRERLAGLLEKMGLDPKSLSSISTSLTPEEFQKKLREEEEALRRRFTDQVKQEESRFRAWEQRVSFHIS